MPLTVGDAPAVERAAGLFVSGNYFEALALRPAAGRLLTPEDAGAPGRQPVAVISHDYWQTHYGAARTAVGSTIRVNGQALEIVGVAPARFQGTTLGLAFDLWIPATMASTLVAGSRELVDRSQGGYTLLGRLRAGTAPVAAGAELDAAARELSRTHPATDGALGIELHAFNDPPRGPQRMINGALALLQTVMLLVLVAVCGNVANLLLARASVRQRDFGVRLALGAPRRRVAWLVLLEALLLSAAGTGIGLVLALWGTQAVRAGEISGAMSIRFQTEIDGVGLAVASGLGVLCALAAAATPVWLLSRLDPQDTLRLAIRSRSRSVVREILMGLQVALALLVLVVAGLFFQRFQEGRGLDPGFRAEGVLLAAYDCRGRDATPDGNRAFAVRVLRGLRAVPGVESAALAFSVPLDIHGLPSRSFALEGRADTGTPDEALSNIVTSGYLATMGIPLVAGTDFADLDDAAAPPQAIVNQAFVRATRRTARSSGDGSCRGASPTSSSAWPARPPTTRSARRRRRWCSIRIGIARSPPPRCTCARAPAPSWRWPRRSAASSRTSIRACRCSTCARCPSTSRGTWCCAAYRRGCSWCSDRCSCCSPRSASMPSSTTASRSGRARSPCVWRWGRRVRPSSGGSWRRRSPSSVWAWARPRSWPSRWICTWYAAGCATCPCWSACRCCSFAVGAVAAWLPARRASRVQPASVLRAILAGLALPCAAVTLLARTFDKSNILIDMQDALRKFKAQVFQALAHPTRIAIIEALRDGELPAGKLLELLQVEQANLSQHLAVLRSKQVLVNRKVGNQVFYAVRDPVLIEVLDLLRQDFFSHLNETLAMLGELEQEASERA